jgi:hypothetical protein
MLAKPHHPPPSWWRRTCSRLCPHVTTGSGEDLRHFSTPYGEVKLVTVKALLPSELAHLLEHGAEGQAELARRFAESGEAHLSRLRRNPRG